MTQKETNVRDDVMIGAHMNILVGDTYFQQLAVLGTAQQNNNKTKGRKAEIRKAEFLYFTIKKK